MVVLVLALFVFENMRALVATLEKNETTAIAAQGDLQADMHALKARQGRSDDAALRFFDRIEALPAPETGRELVRVGKGLRLEIRRPLGPGSGLLFVKTIGSRQLDALRGLKKVLSGLVALLGLLLAIAGIYFMWLMFRKQPEAKLGAGSPLQDYLVEMKSAQAELQTIVAEQRRASSEREELNKSIINTVHLAVIYLSGTGKVEIFNPAAQKLFNRGFAAAKNVLLAEVLARFPELARFILAATAKSSAEVESNGAIFFVDVVPVGEGLQGRLALVRDVSDERRRERVRRQSDNLMMLGEMAASLAHEVRNSLGVVLGYSKALGGEPEKKRKVVREIEYMSEMMESFLRFARPVEPASRVPVDLGPLAVAAAAAQGLAVDLPAAALTLSSDPLLLTVVFSNLALNARQSGASRLRLEFSPGSAPAVIVADDGPGIAAAVADRIWLPFFTTREKGTGMGLATVKKLISALGADIQLLNPGEPGAKFRITFYT
jgi:signal transduction histidine kinase